ncbi:MAG TPA: alkane 1-monooxygenase [Steroidobacteraceae bacterium]|nr:alkane 1-monooxygenase [Steroidobacteraceae bacterium]
MLLRRLGFVLPLLLPLLVVAGYRLGGAWNFLTVGWLFVALPLADFALGPDPRPVLEDGRGSAGWARFFDAILYLWVPLQLALLVWAAAVFPSLPDLASRAGLAYSTGVVTGGVGIVVAHELGHRRRFFERALGCTLLASVGYAHFYIEHNKGHHARVATPEDPATARAGESFWHFLPRTVAGQFASAWRIERARLAARGLGPASAANRMLWAVAAPLAIVAGLGLWRGAAGVALFVVQAGVAVTLLELVNYLEHYGLVRRRRADGRYESVTARHSWNSSQQLSNWFLFNLQRHSHHHAHVTRHYQELLHMPDAPQLPTGYGGMLVFALVPPLWRRIMDPRLEAWRALDAGRTP